MGILAQQAIAAPAFRPSSSIFQPALLFKASDRGYTRFKKTGSLRSPMMSLIDPHAGQDLKICLTVPLSIVTPA